MRRLAARPGRLWRGPLVACVALLLAAGGSLAQPTRDWVLGSRDGGTVRLVVWIVYHQTNPRRRPQPFAGALQPQVRPDVYHEQTAGSFGQSAGSVGQTAGSAGTSVGSFGQNAGSVGQTAGSTGQTAGDSSHDAMPSRSAGDAGRTMGEFGVSSTDLPRAAAAANSVNALLLPHRDGMWSSFVDHTQVPGFELRFVDVYDDDLEGWLRQTAGTADAPDVLVGDPLLWARTHAGSDLLLLPLWQEVVVVQSEDVELHGAFTPEIVVLKASRDVRAAEWFAIWLAGSRIRYPFDRFEADPSVGAVATNALKSLLAGTGPGADADPEMAPFDVTQAVAAGLAPIRQTALTTAGIQVHAMSSRVTGSLALVRLEAIAADRQGFGLTQATAVLRKNAAGRWKVLQISPYLSPEMEQQIVDHWAAAMTAPTPSEGGHPLGISQAAPADGDIRPAQPELAWDNRGGATLQVVEWQRNSSAGWLISHLFLVPDVNAHLRTRAVARFAVAGQYRWRVWSVAKDGTMVLSGWRTLNILGR